MFTVFDRVNLVFQTSAFITQMILNSVSSVYYHIELCTIHLGNVVVLKRKLKTPRTSTIHKVIDSCHITDLAGRWKILMTLKQEKYNLTCRKDCRILGTFYLFSVYCACGVNVFNVLVQCVFLHACVNEWKSAFVLYLNAYCKRDTLTTLYLIG